MSTACREAGLVPTPLRPGDVHLRTIDLRQPDSIHDALAALLSDGEGLRASRFVFERHRREYVVCRGALRVALGAYLGVSPGTLAFSYGERGKPALHEYPELEFNVSHAAGLAVFAFARTGAVGVDVESLDRTVDFEGLSARFFSDQEAREVGSVPERLRARAFFNCWTRKEAYIKAIGDGLACPLDSFAVTLLPDQPPALRWIEGGDARAWRIMAFQPRAGYVAAVGMPWAPARVDVREWRLEDGLRGALRLREAWWGPTNEG